MGGGGEEELYTGNNCSNSEHQVIEYSVDDGKDDWIFFSLKG